MYDCKILADSVSQYGQRLTTFQITYPYIIHAEIMTHRMFSRNTQSSRATPVMANVGKVRADPFVPLTFRKNVKGMADGEAMTDDRLQLSEMVWKEAIEHAVTSAEALDNLEVHKALANRVLSPYQWFTMILTATDFDNFFALRCHPEAQAEIRTIAEIMKEQYDESEPHLLREGWHLPLVSVEDRVNWDWETLVKIAIGRCARVSYLTHNGRRDPRADIALYERLLQNGHMSPFEHVARPFTQQEWDAVDSLRYALVKAAHWPDRPSDAFRSHQARQVAYAGNLHGWWSARMDVPNQHNYALAAVNSDGEPD